MLLRKLHVRLPKLPRRLANMNRIHRFKTRRITQSIMKELKTIPDEMAYDYLEGRLTYKFKPHIALEYALESPNDDSITCLMRPLTWKCWDPLYLTDES